MQIMSGNYNERSGSIDNGTVVGTGLPYVSRLARSAAPTSYVDLTGFHHNRQQFFHAKIQADGS